MTSFPPVWWFGVCGSFLLVACGQPPLPPSQGSRDASRPDLSETSASPDGTAPFDGAVEDGALEGGGLDGPPPAEEGPDGSTASDGTSPGEGGLDAAMDLAPADALPDRSADALPDLPSGPMVCSFTPDQMAVFAVRMALCTFRSPQAVLNESFRPDSWEGGSVQERSCPSLQCVITTRGDCASVLGECLKYTAQRPMGGCPTPAASCEGTPPRTAITCSDGVQVRDDCNARGRRCASSATEAACIPMAGMGESCAPGAPPRCRGSVFEQCVLGTYTPVRDCAVSGAVCDATVSGGCRGDGAPCTGDEAACEGTLLRVCRNGRIQRIDCGRIVAGASCQTVMGHAFCGTAAECDPTVAPPNGTCDGNTLVTCAGGRIARFVCSERGFTSCGAQGCQ